MTMGPPQAEEALRETLALGADRAIHALRSRVRGRRHARNLAERSPWLRKEGVDLVSAGVKSTDSETWQVPPEVAAFLGVPASDDSASALDATGGRLRVVARRTAGRGLRGVPLPAVVSWRPRRPRTRRSGRRRGRRLDGARPRGRRRRERQAVRPAGVADRVLAVRDVTPERAGAIAARSTRRASGSRRCSPSGRRRRRRGRSRPTPPNSRRRRTTAGC